MIVGVPANPYALNVPKRIMATAESCGVPARWIDLATLTVVVRPTVATEVRDRDGRIEVDALSPYLLFGFPAAPHALRVLLRRAFGQNPVDAVLTADDKAATSVRLAEAGVAQVATHICAGEKEQMLAVAATVGYPVVIKRTHGAQGRWVRRAHDAASLAAMFDELAVEGPGAMLVQPLVEQSLGTSIRAIVTGGRLLAATQRRAPHGEWRSNIAGGASQTPIVLRPEEEAAVLASAAALGLGHAGVDLMRTRDATLVLEVNSCPDFTSMLPHFRQDLTRAVLLASLPPGSLPPEKPPPEPPPSQR